MVKYIEDLKASFAALNDQDRRAQNLNAQWLDNTIDPGFFRGLIDRGIVTAEYTDHNGRAVDQGVAFTCIQLTAGNLKLNLSKASRSRTEPVRIKDISNMDRPDAQVYSLLSQI